MNKERYVGSMIIIVFLLLLSNVCTVRADATTPTTIASDLNYPWGLLVDSTNAYWSDQTAGTGNSNQNIRKVGLSGGTIIDLAIGMDCPISIANDSSNIYWVECHTGNVKKVGINGGSVITLATNIAKDAIAVDGTYVYFGSYDGGNVIKKMGINGGAITTLVSGASNPIILTQDGSYIYFADYSLGTINKALKSNGTTTTIVSSESFPQGTSAAVDASNLYWISGNGDSIKKVGLNGGTVTALVSTGANGYHGIIGLDSANVYWIGGGIFMIAKNGGTVTTLVEPVWCSGGFAVTSTAVYWTDSSCSGSNSYQGIIQKYPLSGGGGGTCSQTELDAAYLEGYNDGVIAAKQACKDNPASCGISANDVSNCATLTADGKLSIPCINSPIFNNLSLWFDMIYTPTSTNDILFKVMDFGIHAQ